MKEANKVLLEIGKAVHNMGDVDVRTFAGAIATDTHGTGKELRNLPDMLIGGRMITDTGEVREFSVEDNLKFLSAVRVSMGPTVFSRPSSYSLIREWYCHTNFALEHLDELIDINRNFDSYWYPRSDEVKLRTLNKPEDGNCTAHLRQVWEGEIGLGW